MKLNPDIRLRKIAGEYLLINEGAGNVNFNATFSLSETAAFLWEKCENVEFTEEDMLEWILSEYDVDEATAKADIAETIESWREYGFFV